MVLVCSKCMCESNILLQTIVIQLFLVISIFFECLCECALLFSPLRAIRHILIFKTLGLHYMTSSSTEVFWRF